MLHCNRHRGEIMTPAVAPPVLQADTIVKLQEIGQSSLEGSLRLCGEWAKGWQALAVEVGNFQQRSLEESGELLGQLVEAKSIEQILALQSNYAKRTYDGYVEQVARLGTLYADLARTALEAGEGSPTAESESPAAETPARTPVRASIAAGKSRAPSRSARRGRAA
jgi:hypothetical protein